jgi:uncharacterized coiled-coil protein SlyX
MTTNVTHMNDMLADLKSQHQSRIDYLNDQISNHQKEIKDLQFLIHLLIQEKEYDC